MEKVQPAYPKGLDFEQVWAALMETRSLIEENARRQAETQAKTQAETRSLIEENARRQAETRSFIEENARRQAETDLQMKETDKKISRLGDRFGEMIEHMVMPNLLNKFRELGFVFTKAYPHATIEDEKNRILTEIDITLENGDKVMIVEVKSKPSIKDIKDHVERMGKVRLHADLHGDIRKYLGAVAGMVMNGNVQDYALKNGFYVVEPSGDTFNIIKPEGEYHPREW